MTSQKPITFKDVLRQLKADLIGKDSYRGVTLTYSWLANQFGHFSLGFVPSLLIYTTLKRYTHCQDPSFWAALIIAVCWFLFETYNFLGPLLLKQHSKSKLLFIPGRDYSFEPAWGNIAFDTITDLCFFWIGAFSACLFLVFAWKIVFILAALLIAIIYPCCYWFQTKMYLQAAVYPFQFRLSQWDVNINKEDKKAVLAFLENEYQAKHLFVFGGRRSGKTSLAVGVATELSIRHNSSTYTTGMKLYSMFFESDSILLAEDRTLWSWRTGSVLVIDDINPGNPVAKDLVFPVDFLAMLDTYTPPNDENRTAIKAKKAIWVLGDDQKNKLLFTQWKQMLLDIGVSGNDILAVHLQKSYLP